MYVYGLDGGDGFRDVYFIPSPIKFYTLNI